MLQVAVYVPIFLVIITRFAHSTASLRDSESRTCVNELQQTVLFDLSY